MSQCDKLVFWTDYFNYLHHSLNQFAEVQAIQTKYQDFLSRFGVGYQLYLLDQLEMYDQDQARARVIQLCKDHPREIEVQKRLLQFFKRTNNSEMLQEYFEKFLNSGLNCKEHTYYQMQYLKHLWDSKPQEAILEYKNFIVKYGYIRQVLAYILERVRDYYSNKERYYDIFLEFTLFVLA